MIVNPAYIYMDKKEPPANPIVLDKTTVNYHYTKSSGVIVDTGSNFFIPVDEYMTFTLPLKQFKNVNITAASQTLGKPATLIIDINSTNLGTFQISKPLQSIAIPNNLRVNDAVLKITAVKTASRLSAVTLS